MRIGTFLMTAVLLAGSAMPAAAQHNRNNNNRGNYYSGMNQTVRGGNYDQRYREYDRKRHRDDSGGIGPGYGALIGGGGGAALGAIFGGGLKGTLIGGAAGAGLGALGGKLAEGSDNKNHSHRH